MRVEVPLDPEADVAPVRDDQRLPAFVLTFPLGERQVGPSLSVARPDEVVLVLVE